MSIPPEIAFLVPIIVPLVIGLLVGVLIKNALKFILILAALVIVLVATGAISISFSDLYDKAMQFLPKLYDTGHGWLNVLPYSSAAFLIGLALGLWKG
jgi:uncharacterized membrane protein (Fun14 family)